MKLQLLSDLHLEVHPHLQVAPAPGADLLVLAGDIGSYQAGSRWPSADFGLAPLLAAPRLADAGALRAGQPRVRQRRFRRHPRAPARDLRARWTSSGWSARRWCIDGVRFVGTTLWADFDALVEPGDSLAEALKKRGKAMRAANFYLQKAATTRDGEPFLADALAGAGAGLPGLAARGAGRSRSTARPWRSRISRPAWRAPIRATA